MTEDRIDMIPVGRYYRNIRILMLFFLAVTTVIAILAYYAGEKQGDTNAELEQALHANKARDEVYEKDREIMSELPDHRDVNAWAKWMRK